MTYLATTDQLREEARVEALAARDYAQQALNYARRLNQKWRLGLADKLVVRLTGFWQ